MAPDDVSDFQKEPDSSVASATTRHESHAEIDAVRHYFNQVGRIALLTPHEERVLWQRVEAARSAVAAALLTAPAAARHLTALAGAVREGTTIPDSLLLSPEGRPLGKTDVAEALNRLAQAARQVSHDGGSQKSWIVIRRSRSSRTARWYR
jgi:hypothetical protein